MRRLYLLLLLLAVFLRIYVVYSPGVLLTVPILKLPLLDILLLLGLIVIVRKKTNVHVVLALISNFIAGNVINRGTTMDEKTVYFFMGMAFYFSLHVNLILYFIRINPGWKEAIKMHPFRILLPGICWLAAYFSLVFHLPTIGIIPVFIYSGIYVLLIAMAWNLDKILIDKSNYMQLLAGTVFFMLSDIILGFVLFTQFVQHTTITSQIINMRSAIVTWDIGVFLVFYSLVYIQKEMGIKGQANSSL